ncbi:MAG: hypothetical protein ACI8ZM_000531 [Crocinitomix sp.]|jgi:hypothetical protein
MINRYLLAQQVKAKYKKKTKEIRVIIMITRIFLHFVTPTGFFQDPLRIAFYPSIKSNSNCIGILFFFTFIPLD